MAGSVGKAVMEAILEDEELARYGAKTPKAPRERAGSWRLPMWQGWGAGWCLRVEGHAKYLAYQEIQFSEWNDFKAMRNRIASIKWLRGE